MYRRLGMIGMAAAIGAVLTACEPTPTHDAAGGVALRNARGVEMSGAGNGSYSGQVVARAELSPSAGHDVRGTVELSRHADAVTVDVMLTGLVPGEHEIEVYDNDDCASGAATTRFGAVLADRSGAVNLSVQSFAGLAESAVNRAIVVQAVVARPGEGLETMAPVACGVIRRVVSSGPLGSSPLTSRVATGAR